MEKYISRGKKLAEFITQKGYSKGEFARRVGIYPQNVALYLSGKLDPLNLVEGLRREGCDLNWLCNDDAAPVVRESTPEYSADEEAAIEAEAQRLAQVVKYSGPANPSKRIRDEMLEVFRKVAREKITREKKES